MENYLPAKTVNNNFKAGSVVPMSSLMPNRYPLEISFAIADKTKRLV